MLKTPLFSVIALWLPYLLTAQNMVVNPGAENLPRGTGWTIISQGPLTCTVAPTNNIDNWTMIPIGSANYPFDHTTGASGGTVFFSGCASYFGGPYELQQSIDVSANAGPIDLGNELYSFGGFMQTPVDNQTDQGRFIVDFLDASNAVLGTSYTSSWQSYFNGSGTDWIYYNDTRLAPIGTRSILIRMQTQIHFNQPAVNVYFDDISLTRPSILPVNLLSFTGNEHNGLVNLNWLVDDGLQLQYVEVLYKNDVTQFNRIGSVAGGSNRYYIFTHQVRDDAAGHSYYQIKLVGKDGRISYSQILRITETNNAQLNYSPNPVNSLVTVKSSLPQAQVDLFNNTGQLVLSGNISGGRLTLDVSRLADGLYTLRCSNSNKVLTKKLIIKHN